MLVPVRNERGETNQMTNSNREFPEAEIISNLNAIAALLISVFIINRRN